MHKYPDIEISKLDFIHAIARGAAMECAAIMDILECMQLIDSATAKQAKDNLSNVVKILSAVCSQG